MSETAVPEVNTVNFPQYQKPQGIIVAPPKFQAPLYKMMKMMMKPKKRLPKPVKRVKKKKVTFY